MPGRTDDMVRRAWRQLEATGKVGVVTHRSPTLQRMHV